MLEVTLTAAERIIVRDLVEIRMNQLRPHTRLRADLETILRKTDGDGTVLVARTKEPQ